MTEIDFQYNFEEEYTANVTETVLKTKYSFPQAKKKKKKGRRKRKKPGLRPRQRRRKNLSAKETKLSLQSGKKYTS